MKAIQEAPIHFKRVLLLEQGGPERALIEAFQALMPEVALEVFSVLGLDFKALATKIKQLGAERVLIHPGLSVWAERPDFVTLCQDLGHTVLAPSAKTLALMGNRLNLLLEGECLGLKHLIITPNPVTSVREIEKELETEPQPYPCVLKSLRGPSSLGLRVIRDEQDLKTRVPLWIEQLKRNQGEGILFLERYLEGARRITVPFARFSNGRYEAFPLLCSSLMSRSRKIVEFCPGLPSQTGQAGQEMEAQLVLASQRLAEHLGYVGVGAFEFFVDSGKFYFVDAQARLNTSFHLWEKAMATQALAWQLATLLNWKAPERKDSLAQLAAVRIYAEDPVLQLPQPGLVTELDVSTVPEPDGAVEVQVFVEQGKNVPTDGMGLVAMLFVMAEDRESLLARARASVQRFWISGTLQTNERFLLDLLAHPWVVDNMIHVCFVEEEFIPSLHPSQEILDRAAALLAHKVPGEESRWLVADRWAEKVEPQNLQWLDQNNLVWVPRGKASQVGKRALRVSVVPVSENRWLVRQGTPVNWTLNVRRVPPAARATSSVRRIFALMSGRVEAILYQAEAYVPAHSPLLMLTAYGVLVPHALPTDARVISIEVKPGQEVRMGDTLLVFEMIKKTVS